MPFGSVPDIIIFKKQKFTYFCLLFKIHNFIILLISVAIFEYRDDRQASPLAYRSVGAANQISAQPLHHICEIDFTNHKVLNLNKICLYLDFC